MLTYCNKRKMSNTNSSAAQGYRDKSQLLTVFHNLMLGGMVIMRSRAFVMLDQVKLEEFASVQTTDL